MKACLKRLASKRLVYVAAVLVFASASTASVTAAAFAPPENLVYQVKLGDTLIDLAEAFFTNPDDYKKVQELNLVEDPRRLRTGQSLNLPVNLLRVVPAQAEVSSYRGQVTVTIGSRARAPALRQSLSEGALITTGANSYLRLSLSDGSHLVVPSNSRVRLSRLKRYVINGAVDYDLEVQRGRLESRVTPRQFPGGYRVTTPVSVTAVRGTEFRIGLNAAADRAATEVLEGRVEVEWEGAAEAAIGEANSAISVGGAGAVVATLPPAPRLADPDLILTKPEIELKVKPQDGALAYRGRLALDAGLIEIIAETESEPGSNALKFDALDDGLYYLSVSAISPDGIEGHGSTYNLVRIKNQIRFFGNNGLSDSKRRAHRFRWDAGGMSKDVEDKDIHYRFILHRQDADGALVEPAILDRVGLVHPNVSVMGLSRGIYSWRIQTSQTLSGQMIDSWSEPRILHVGQ